MRTENITVSEYFFSDKITKKFGINKVLLCRMEELSLSFKRSTSKGYSTFVSSKVFSSIWALNFYVLKEKGYTRQFYPLVFQKEPAFA